MPAPVDISDPFRALADPKRREILDLLASGPLPVRMIAGHFPDISRPAVSKHLRMLREGGLVREEPSGRQRYYSLVGETVAEILEWIEGVGGGAATATGDADRASVRRIAAKPEVAASPRGKSKRSRSAGSRARRRRERASESDDWKSW